MEIGQATEKIKELAKEYSGKLNAKVKFKLPEGEIFLDDTVTPTEVHNSDDDSDCTIVLNKEVLYKLLNKEETAIGAYMKGKMKIQGNMQIAMKLANLF